MPSLGALRTFEMAARLGSFQQAAQELNLTPSAISYQIRVLEDALGQPLFIRQHRKISLTPAGLTLQHYVDRGFAELRSGAAAVKLVRDPNLVRVTSAPAFANAFLTHRISDFERRFPRLELQLVVAHSVLDLVANNLDVAIRFAVDPPSELHAEELAGLLYTPICTPALARDLKSVDDLARSTRIVIREHPAGWSDWAAQLGREECPGREMVVETMNVGVQGALDGLAVSLLPRVIVASHLAAGRLIAPFPENLVSRYRYWLVCRRGDEQVGKIRRFAGWLREEMSRMDVA